MRYGDSDLQKRIRKVELALQFPVASNDEGFGLFAEMAQRSHWSVSEDDFKLLMDYLGLEIETGSRIVKKEAKK